MGQFARGAIVLVKFPFTDLSQTKLRPALVLAEVEYGDLLLCQLTSKTYGDRNAVTIDQPDLQSGSLPVTSYARPARLLTGSPALVTRSIATLHEGKHDEVVVAIVNLLR